MSRIQDKLSNLPVNLSSGTLVLPIKPANTFRWSAVKKEDGVEEPLPAEGDAGAAATLARTGPPPPRPLRPPREAVAAARCCKRSSYHAG